MRIDSHQHFWQYDPIRDHWITDEMSVIQKNFMPKDLKPVLDENKIDGCIAVQADQSEKETEFLLGLAAKNEWIKGVVGWVDLLNSGVEERLEHFKVNSLFKGVRHILQAEQPGFMTADHFIKGVSLVGRHQLTYDILTREGQLEEVLSFIKRLPEMPLVIDHISKPDIKHHSFKHWAEYMKKISEFPQVHVKLSGMVTEADWHHWTTKDFQPYIDFCLEKFGSKRLMFGSDWPVCLLAGTYSEILNLLKSHISRLSSSEINDIMGETAIKFYQLQV